MVRIQDFKVVGKRPYEFQPEGRKETVSGYTLFASRPFENGEGVGEYCCQVSVSFKTAAEYACDVGDTIGCVRVGSKWQMVT